MSKPPIPAEYAIFEEALKRVVSVPREEVDRRLAEYKEESAKKPVRPGPKPKRPAVNPQPKAQNS